MLNFFLYSFPNLKANTLLTLYSLSNFSICFKIALGSGAAFLVAQLLDVYIFDKLRKKVWYVAPLTSSIIGSTIDTFLFFSIAFYGTSINWLNLSFGDLSVKIIVALVMLIPFRILLSRLQEVSAIEKKISV